jgi:C4-dicarboxylate transporter, DctM subunit
MSQRDTTMDGGRLSAADGKAARRADGPPVAFIIYVVLLAGLAVAMFQPIESELVAVAAIGMLFVMLAMRMPVAIAMALPGTLGIWASRGWPAASRSLTEIPFSSVSGWSLSVLPMFIFMGLVLWRSGATTVMYEASRQWLGWLPGGLAITTNFTGAGLAAASGSTVGITYALGRIGVPEMLKAGYDRRLSVASVLMAGTGGQLIPPSILLVIYAGITQIGVGQQLLAGFLPGILLAVAFGAMILALVLVFPSLAPRNVEGTEAPTWQGRWASAARTWPIPLLVLIVIGGLYVGVFTATEAGAFGALGAIIMALSYLGFRDFWPALKLALQGTVASVGSIMFLLMGAVFFNRLIVVSGAASWFAATVDDLGLSRVGFLLALIVLYLVLGMFMDPIGMMLVTVPILMPALRILEIDLLWFGVFVVLLAELSILTPPVGILAYVMNTIVKDPEVNCGVNISLGDIFIGALWFIPISVVVLIILIAFPEFVTWLPDRMAR